MKQTFDLNKMGLSPMNDEEMQEIDGWGLVFRYRCTCCSTKRYFHTLHSV
jgi:hypothetical protein